MGLLWFKFSPRVSDVGSAAAIGAASVILIILSYKFSSGQLLMVALLTRAMGGAAGTVAIRIALKLYRLKVTSPNLSNDMPVGNNAPMTTRSMKLTEEFAKLRGPKKFSYEELIIMTASFADDRILGRGGFGIVYKGNIGDAHTQVAVKIINPDSDQGIKEYISEVKSLSRLRHKNLVQLEGYCHKANRFALVYEFIGGGNLEDYLFKCETLLKWDSRYEIARGLASALHYLHREYHQCVIHRDIKSSNIMLDKEFMAKLGDFGLARLVDHVRGRKTTEKMGTLGYAAPEYQETGEASKKSDIYSFGVVLLELVCGRSVSDRELRDLGGLVQWVWKHYGCRSGYGSARIFSVWWMGGYSRISTRNRRRPC